MTTGRWHGDDEPDARSEVEEERPLAAQGVVPTQEPTPAQLAEGPAVAGDEAATPPPEPEPEPAIPVSQSSHRQPPGGAVPFGGSDPAASAEPAQRPEVLAGAAFAGGLVVAMLLRRVLS